MQCSIALGKFLSVQTGIDFSGGSRDEPSATTREPNHQSFSTWHDYSNRSRHRIATRTALGKMWHHDLHVPLGTKRAAFQKRFLIIDASAHQALRMLVRRADYTREPCRSRLTADRRISAPARCPALCTATGHEPPDAVSAARETTFLAAQRCQQAAWSSPLHTPERPSQKSSSKTSSVSGASLSSCARTLHAGFICPMADLRK